MLFTASLWIIAGWILRICERFEFSINALKISMFREYVNVDLKRNFGYVDSIWLVAITFLSVGYGSLSIFYQMVSKR